MSSRSFLASMGAKLALRGCDAVGQDVRLTGRPSIANRGRLDIGRGTMICSRPVAAQLATGTHGTLLIGECVTIGYGCSIVAEGLITIGEGTRIGPFGMLCDAENDGLSGWRHTARPIVIGRNVRIGSKVAILPGTYIADGADIAAGSVLSGTFATQEAATGAPAGLSGAHTFPAADVEQRIALLLRDVFDRTGAAPLSLELERISGWGAGGALRLLLAVEEEFHVTIPDEEWLAICSLGDLVRTIERWTPPISRQVSPSELFAGHVE